MPDPVPGAAAARPAATVMLLRDGPAGVEAWLLRRVAAMAFAPGMTVFPGGRVDATDADPGLEWHGPAPVDELRAATVAAVRETFEETAVLLVRPTPPAAVLARYAEVEARRIGFTTLLAEAGLRIDADRVRAWARWITPVDEPRRYDTWFFVAALPDGATARAVSGESVTAQWASPAVALAEVDAGTRSMLPPTAVALRELAGFASVDDVLAAAPGRDLTPVEPVLSADRRSATVGGVVLPMP